MIIVPDFDYARVYWLALCRSAPSLPIKDVNQQYFWDMTLQRRSPRVLPGLVLSGKEEILSMCASFELMERKGRFLIHSIYAILRSSGR